MLVFGGVTGRVLPCGSKWSPLSNPKDGANQLPQDADTSSPKEGQASPVAETKQEKNRKTGVFAKYVPTCIFQGVLNGW